MLPVFLALAVIALLVIVLFAGQPDEFVYTRSLKMAAPPEKIFPHVNELRKWEPWNPWGKLDPNVKVTFDGPTAGVGASYAWAGNNKVGAGKNTIIESRPDALVGLRLDFEKPMQAVNHAKFTFQPEDGQTLVTWTMTGKNSGMGKVFGLFMNCEKMCGGQFEKGLASLKQVVEQGAA